MSQKTHIRHVFPGGNTSKGFYSFYDYILPQDEARRIMVLKGGPGVGKSTFMKKIANEMMDRGYDVEFMHCSSDNNSLDGIVIPSIKVALMDGTSPHVVEPKNPGCIDEIINLGDYWNEDGLRADREEIVVLKKEIGKNFTRAYKYIAAAKAIYDDLDTIMYEAMDKAKINIVANDLINDLFKNINVSNKLGKDRHLFASAITPEGFKNYLDSIVGVTSKVYILKGLSGTGIHGILEKIVNASIERGMYTECYHCALNPENIEHIVIRDLDISLTTSNEYHMAQIDKSSIVLNMNTFLNSDIIDKYKDIIEFDTNEVNYLLNKAVSILSNSKKIHDKLELYYIPNMDFTKIQKMLENTLKRILKYAQE